MSLFRAPKLATLRRYATAGLVTALTCAATVVLSDPAGAGEPTGATVTAASASAPATSFTGIDPGPGQFYSYAPSIIQTSPTTRDVFYCGNAQSGVVRDHVFLSVGHRGSSGWRYGTPKVVLSPKTGTFYSYHACEPQVLGGNYRFGSTAYQWAMFFTAEPAPSNSTNSIGLAFAHQPAGPWVVDPSPIIDNADDFGANSDPNDCPVQPTGTTFYCVGEPAATTLPGGQILLTTMGNSGSPGNDTNPVEGPVEYEVSLTDVPGTGPCTQCLLTLPNGGNIRAITSSGLDDWFHDIAIAYDPASKDVVMVYDDGGGDSTPNPPPVTKVVTVATLPLSQFLAGTGTWTVEGNLGECQSGFTDNHNAGIVQLPNGDMPAGSTATVMYTVADDDLAVDWGVYDYRMWSWKVPLGAHVKAATEDKVVTADSLACPGVVVAGSKGSVTTGGTAQHYGASHSGAGTTAGMATTPDGLGYYLVTSTGTVETFGDAHYQGEPASGSPGGAAVGIAVDADTGGYWVARANGTVDGFGAPDLGSASVATTTGPVVAIAGMPSGQGYYLATAQGDVSAFGNETAYGNFAVPAGQTVTAIATTPNGLGYYLVTAQGTLADFGDAQLYGPVTVPATSPVVGIAIERSGFGYWTLQANGTLTPAGTAPAGVAPPPGNRGSADPSVAVAAF